MNNAKTDFNELLELCGKVRDNQLSVAELTRLETLLLGDPMALQFYQRFMTVCSGLEQISDTASSTCTLESTTDEAIEKEISPLPDESSSAFMGDRRPLYSAGQSGSDRNRFRARIATLVTAAAVLLAVGVWLGWRGETVDRGSLVAVVGEVQTVWGDDFVMPASQRLSAGQYVLRSGATQLRFDHGVELLIQAPSMFSLDNEMQATLATGTLTLFVPVAAKGFRVETPLGTVVDQGTRIGIMTDEEDGLAVHVFEGRADTIVKESVVRETLTAGQAVTVVREEGQPAKLTRMPVNASYFADSLNDLNDLPTVQGDIDLLVSPPRSVRRIASELVDVGRASLFAEVQDLTLDSDLKVTCAQPGRCAELETLNEMIPAGTRIDTYFVHLTMPRKMRTGDQHLTAGGTIVFQRPVLAVVAHEPGRMDASLRSSDTDYPLDRRTGLEDAIDGNSDFADQISLSDDRRTLTFQLDVHGRRAGSQEDFADQFRVLIQAKKGP